MGVEWEWVNVTINTIQEKIEQVKSSINKKNIVFNLCDGDEINQTPGISVIHALKANNIAFTGSELHFYDVTTSKITMKMAFDKQQIGTPKWQKLNGHIDQDLFGKVGTPIIVKPAVSAGSMGISVANVVSNNEELQAVLDRVKQGYKGWKLDEDGILAEQFIKGREFTVMLVGSYSNPKNIMFYQPVERVFHPALPENEQFLSFDRLWAHYQEEARMPNDDDFYDYAPVEDSQLVERIKDLSIKAYLSVEGTGYTRIDIRMDKATGELYVLEVNAQCGLSKDENQTSIGAILRVSGKTFTDLVMEVLDDALDRHNPTPI
jgi:D-alanine-D-alanine ligase